MHGIVSTGAVFTDPNTLQIGVSSIGGADAKTIIVTFDSGNVKKIENNEKK